MKKIFTLMLIASAFFTMSASAQTQERVKGKMANQKQVMIDSLKISEASADSVIAIRTQSMGQIKAIMNDQSLSQDQKKEKMKPIKEEMKTKMEKYLTKEQMAKLQEMKSGMRKDKDGE